MAIWRSGAEIVDRIYRTQERKKKIIAEEMNAVIEERDAALAQVSPHYFIKGFVGRYPITPFSSRPGKMELLSCFKVLTSSEKTSLC